MRCCKFLFKINLTVRTRVLLYEIKCLLIIFPCFELALIFLIFFTVGKKSYRYLIYILLYQYFLKKKNSYEEKPPHVITQTECLVFGSIYFIITEFPSKFICYKSKKNILKKTINP